MTNTILSNAVEQFKNLFREDVALQFARESRLIQRTTSKLNPFSFLKLMVIDMSLVGAQSLTTMCELLRSNGSVRITEQALSQRLASTSAVKFLKLAYSKILDSKLSQINFHLREKGILGRFKNVYLEDSTSCNLHEKAAGFFKGCGGSGSHAGYKIHTIWNAARNCIERMLITSSKDTDQSRCYDIISYVKKADLVLRDLGYFALPCFRKITELGAFFLSRLKSKVKVYTPEGSQIEDLGMYVEKIMKNSNMAELEVLIGAKERLLVRLIAYKVTDNVYNQRVRRLRKTWKKHGNTPCKATLKFNRFTFFITNIPPELLATAEAATLYMLRWEVELLFKNFKSNFHVDMIKGHSKCRIECFIISKLISILVTTILYSYVSIHARIQNLDLSFTKFLSWIFSHKFLRILFQPDTLNYEVMQMKNFDIIPLCKQKRSRKSTNELLRNESTYFEIYPESSVLEPLTSLA